MNCKILWRDIRRNKAVSCTTALFITAAAMLLSLAAILTVSLTGAIGHLMEDAKTPHMMQMYSGGLDRQSLETFAREQENVSDFQILEFLNVDSSKLVLGEFSLRESLQDNGFSTQSGRFDFLLDMDNRPVHPKKGELYVPVCYYRDKTAKVGDRAVIDGHSFVVAGFIRDSQMNSALASSKRFIVNEDDFQLLKPSGTMEYLIEFRLNELSALSAFETAYSEAGLPSNGPTLTWPLFQMISAVSDGIMIGVILLIGILVIVIALLCVRFTLLAKIEEDYREIGVMKAVGMRVSDIRRIYLTVYAVIAAAGSFLGFLLALAIQKPMQESIRMNLGNGGGSQIALLLSLVGAAVVWLLILLYVNLSLRQFRKISAVQAIRFGMEQENDHGAGTFQLSGRCFPEFGGRWLSANCFLGIKDILTRKRLYATMLAVVALASFIMIVPKNLYHTISGDNFVTYMGIGECDLRMDLQQTDGIDEKASQAAGYLGGRPEVRDYALLTTKIVPVLQPDGTIGQIKVELGDHTVFPLQYAEGRMPVSDSEIALSAINAEELEKQVGQSVTILLPEGEKMLTVSGIYSDITNGGKTAKAVFTADSTETAWTVICASLYNPGADLPALMRDTKAQFPFAKVSGIDEYVAQTFGQTLRSVQTASRVAIVIAAAVIFLITLLFMKLLVAKDRYSIAVMRAIGFHNSDIRSQYLWRAVVVLALGILIGTVLAGTMGETLAGLVIASLGAVTFHFTGNPQFTFLAAPLLMTAAALFASILGTSGAGHLHINESIKE